MLSNAFNYIIQMRGRSAQIKDLNDLSIADITIADSNYFRKLEGVEETIVEGKEFVVMAKDFETFGEPKRGHRIIHSPTEYDNIGEVKPLRGLKGQLLGYRIRIQ